MNLCCQMSQTSGISAPGWAYNLGKTGSLMIRHRHRLFPTAALLLVGLVCASVGYPLSAQSAKPAAPNQTGKMTGPTRLLVIRSLQSERVFARIVLPQGDKGIKIKNGVVSPNEEKIAQEVAEFGQAAKPGDRCVITDVQIKENLIIVELNGGSKKHEKWYQHIEVGAGGGMTQVPGGPSPQSLDAHGTTVTLEFDKYIPELTGDQVREMLGAGHRLQGVNALQRPYQKTLPPKVKEAIKDHKILVGMDKEMVTFAKGRPPRKIRDKDEKGQDYEEWIYGTPPEEVDFVRFKGNEVARLEIMTVDGQKVVRTEKEVDLPSKDTELAEQKPAPEAAECSDVAAARRGSGVSDDNVRSSDIASAGPESSTRRYESQHRYASHRTYGRTDHDPTINDSARSARPVRPGAVAGLTVPHLARLRLRRYTARVRIALAQINPTVGDFSGNSAKIIDYALRAKSAGVDLILFPELSVCGYPPRDLVERPWFIERNRKAAEEIAARTQRNLGDLRLGHAGQVGDRQVRLEFCRASSRRRRLPPSNPSAFCRPTTFSTRCGTLPRLKSSR